MELRDSVYMYIEPGFGLPVYMYTVREIDYLFYPFRFRAHSSSATLFLFTFPINRRKIGGAVTAETMSNLSVSARIFSNFVSAIWLIAIN